MPRRDDSSDSDSDAPKKKHNAGALESDSDDEAAPLRGDDKAASASSSDDEEQPKRKPPPLPPRNVQPSHNPGAFAKLTQLGSSLRSVFSKKEKSHEPSRQLMETWKSQGRDSTNTPRDQDIGKDDSDSDNSVDSDGVKRKRLRIDPADMKGGTMQIKDMKTLLQYLEPDADYGTQPIERHLQPIDDWLHKPETCEDIPTYIEDPKTGRWRKLRKRSLSKGERKLRERKTEGRNAVAALDAELDAVDIALKNDIQVEDRSIKLERGLNAFFTASRGALAGLAGGTLIINYALDKDIQLLDHYGRTSNLFRRWGYLLATSAFVGALNSWQQWQINRSAEKPDPVLKLEVRLLVVLYFFALAFTLAMATADVSLAKHWMRQGEYDTLHPVLQGLVDDDWETTFYGPATNLTTFKTWRFCCWARFACAALGWLISLNRFDVLARALEYKKREIDALRGAVRSASTKMIDQANEKERGAEPGMTGAQAYRDLLGRRGLPVPAEAQDLRPEVRNPLVDDAEPSSLKLAALRSKKETLRNRAPSDTLERPAAAENPIVKARVVQSKPRSESGSSDDSSTDDDGPRDLLTGSPRRRR